MGASLALTASLVGLGPLASALAIGFACEPAAQVTAIGAANNLGSEQQTGERAAPVGARANVPWKAFEVRCTLTYAAAPTKPHRLTATYSYPDKARWWLEAGDPSRLERLVQYRSGKRAYEIGARSSTSNELAEDARDALFAQMELRRALTLWPNGVAWQGEGLERTADLGAFGQLWCRFDAPAEPAPAAMGLRDETGAEVSGFHEVKWSTTDGKPRARAAEFRNADELVWTETIDSIQSPVAFIDAFFLPPDRRPAIPTELTTGKIDHVDLPEFWGRRIALSDGVTWEQAFAECRRLRAEAAEKLTPLGIELDRMVTIEVSKAVAPRSCILRLAKFAATPPADFELTRARTGMIMIVAGFGALSESKLQALVKARPDSALEAKPLGAYVRFDPDQAPKGAVLLVLPIDAH